MKYAVLLLLLVLAACEPTEEEISAVLGKLPTGCSLMFLGPLGDINNVVAVRCDARVITTTSLSEQQGKAVSQGAIIWMNEEGL